MSDWKPIQTAPKDRTPVLIYGKDCIDSPFTITICWFTESKTWLTDYDNDLYEATHWMPLPPAPKKEHYCTQFHWVCKEVKNTKVKSSKKFVIFHESDLTDYLCCDQCPFCGEKEDD